MNARMAARALAGLIMLLGLLFIPAGRLDWLQGWLFIVAYIGFIAAIWLWAMRHDPALLAERTRIGANTKRWDLVILSIYGGIFIILLVAAGFDGGRYGWLPLAPLVQAAGWIGLALSGGLVWWVTAVNTFASQTVRIQEERGHQVINSGPYRYVRHPMYAGVIVFMPCLALVLGSGVALIPAALINVLFVIRTALEDRTLLAELPGYKEYAQRVRFRLIPGVW